MSYYHNYEINGVKCPILHLDLKPSNIFLLKETREIIKLFDYDSVIYKDDLNDSDLFLSGSQGYMPYELRKGIKKQISEKTDIYSIGAIVFERIMSRTVTETDEDIGHVELSYENKLFNNTTSKIFDRLNQFFHRTCLGRIMHRYSNMEEVVEALDELIDLAQPIKYPIVKYLPSITENFIGRDDLLKQIDLELEKSNYVILSGMGGIGKTELAIAYANSVENKGKYQSFFFTYKGSMRETILSIDFINFDEYIESKNKKIEDISDEEKLNYKIELLAEYGKTALIVIDNMDMDSKSVSDAVNEPAFAKIVSCGIKLIITSRNTFANHTLQIETLSEEELLSLIDHDDTNIETVKEIIKYVEWHTLTVDLIGKTIRESWGDLTPEKMLDLLKNNDIDSDEFDEVVSDKDRASYEGYETSATIYGHIKKLFKFSNLLPDEIECLENLALFKTGICMDDFIEASCKSFAKIIKTLKKKGWINFNKNTSVIYLHSIIRIVVLNNSSYNDNTKTITWCLGHLKDHTITKIEEIKRIVIISTMVADNDNLDPNLRIELYDGTAYKACYWFCTEHFLERYETVKLQFRGFGVFDGKYLDKRNSIIKNNLINSLKLKENNNYEIGEIIKAYIYLCLFEWEIIFANRVNSVRKWDLEEYLTSNQYWLKAMQLVEMLSEERDLEWTYIYLCYGNMYYCTARERETASKYYLMALELITAKNNNSLLKAEVLIRLGDCYRFSGGDYTKTKKAINYYESGFAVLNRILPEANLLKCYALAGIAQLSGIKYGFNFNDKWYQNVGLVPPYIVHRIKEKKFLASYDPALKLKTLIASIKIFVENSPLDWVDKPYDIYQNYTMLDRYHECERFLETYFKVIKQICELLHSIEKDKSHQKTYNKIQIKEYRREIYLLIKAIEKSIKESNIKNPFSELSDVNSTLHDEFNSEIELLYEYLKGNLGTMERDEKEKNLSNEDIVLVLKGEDGKNEEFELLELIHYYQDDYVVLSPKNASEEVGEVIILKVVIEGDNESYISVDDETIADDIFEIFKERAKDKFDFVD